MKTNKYKAHSFYLDISKNRFVEPQEVQKIARKYRDNYIFFASKHEYAVYRVLQSFCDNCIVGLQPNIEIIPPNKIDCYPKGKTWKADFIIKENSNLQMIVEAKGSMTKDFMLILALLELNNKEMFSKLWLIFPRELPQNLVIKRLLQTSMRKRILTINEFQQKMRKKSFLQS